MVTQLLEARGLSYTVGGRTVLSDISFAVSRGGFLAVIGPNGAGKSTMLKCLGGLNCGVSGEAELEGRSIGRMTERERARRIAWLHQSGSDALPFTVRQFATMSRYPWRPVLGGESEEDLRIVEGALARAGVEKLAERSLLTLSGGERQRALLAAALAQGTDILFLDEPTSFLDYRQQVEMMALVEDINQDGITVLMVTHDINLALHGSTEVLAIKEGRACWHGATAKLLEGSALSDIFDTDFEFFRRVGQRLPYAVPGGFVS